MVPAGVLEMCFLNPITGKSCGPCSVLILASAYSMFICLFYYYYVDIVHEGVLSSGDDVAFFPSGPPSCPFPRCFPHLLRRTPKNKTFQRYRQRMTVPVSVPGHKPLQLRCKSCALVTSSGQLLGKAAGRDIDTAECVIRMNDAPTRGFEPDVGSRTTIRVIGHSNFRPTFQNRPSSQKVHFADERTRSENVILAWLYDTDVYRNPAYRLILNYSQMYRHVSFFMHTLAMVKNNNEIFHNETGITRTQARTWLTTGWHTMLLALDVCNNVTVYGMVDGDYCLEHPNETTPYHYYGNTGNKTRAECGYYIKSEERLTSGHLFVTEKYIFARWGRQYGVRFLHPSWPEQGKRGAAAKSSSSSGSLDTPFLKLYREKYGSVESRRDHYNITSGD